MTDKGGILVPVYRVPTAPLVPSYHTPPYQTGIGGYFWLYPFVPTANISTAKCLDSNGLIAAMPWIVPNAITLTQIGIDITSVTSVDAGGVLRFGIYSDTGGFYPYTLIKDCGTVPGDAISSTNPTFTTAFSLNLLPGIYWVAMATQGMATARPTTGSIGAAAFPPNTYNNTINGRVIPLIGGSAVSRSWYSWTPTTNPAFTVVTTSFLAVATWGGGMTTSSSSWPRLAIRIV